MGTARRYLNESKGVVIFIVGPTAIGKSALAVRLAKRIDGEIISCDSMQVYKNMRILTQAPDTTLRKEAIHHLIEILDPKEEYSAAIFRERAIELIGSILKRRKIPIIVGGSGLYVKGLIDGFFPSPKADLKFRKRMQEFVSTYGSERLYKKLSRIDPEIVKRIHPNDARRIIRALEIYRSTGKTMTEIKKKTKGLKAEYDIKFFGLIKPRPAIYRDIGHRVDKMFRDRLLNEVKRLKDRPLSKTAGAVLGFKEISGYLNGEYDLDRAKEIFKRNTRHFAKRQLTWFKADDRIRWFDVSRMSKEGIIRDIVKEVH